MASASQTVWTKYELHLSKTAHIQTSSKVCLNSVAAASEENLAIYFIIIGCSSVSSTPDHMQSCFLTCKYVTLSFNNFEYLDRGNTLGWEREEGGTVSGDTSWILLYLMQFICYSSSCTYFYLMFFKFISTSSTFNTSYTKLFVRLCGMMMIQNILTLPNCLTGFTLLLITLEFHRHLYNVNKSFYICQWQRLSL